MIWLLTLEIQIFEGKTSKPSDTCTVVIQSVHDWWHVGSHQSLEKSCIEAIGTFQWFRWTARSHLHQLLDRVSQQGGNSTGDDICLKNDVRCFCYMSCGSQPVICMFVQVQKVICFAYWALLLLLSPELSRVVLYFVLSQMTTCCRMYE